LPFLIEPSPHDPPEVGVAVGGGVVVCSLVTTGSVATGVSVTGTVILDEVGAVSVSPQGETPTAFIKARVSPIQLDKNKMKLTVTGVICLVET
jgi:hypothetical protein